MRSLLPNKYSVIMSLVGVKGDYDGGGCDGRCRSGARARLEATKGCDLSRRQKPVAVDEDGIGSWLEQDGSGGDSGTVIFQPRVKNVLNHIRDLDIMKNKEHSLSIGVKY